MIHRWHRGLAGSILRMVLPRYGTGPCQRGSVWTKHGQTHRQMRQNFQKISGDLLINGIHLRWPYPPWSSSVRRCFVMRIFHQGGGWFRPGFPLMSACQVLKWVPVNLKGSQKLLSHLVRLGFQAPSVHWWWYHRLYPSQSCFSSRPISSGRTFRFASYMTGAGGTVEPPNVCPPATGILFPSSFIAIRAKVHGYPGQQATGSGLPLGPSGLT